jgi:hypothetical protein
MRIAYLMNGLFGGLTGKNMDRNHDEHVPIVAKYCKKSIDDFFCPNDTVDFFIFTWHSNHKNALQEIYQPKTLDCRDQATFSIPSCANNDKRSQSHVSRWFGYKQNFSNFEEFSAKEGINYDYVLNARLDICWNRKIVVEDLTKITLSSYTSHDDTGHPQNLRFDLNRWSSRMPTTYHQSDLADHVFGGNFDFMKKMTEIYDKIWYLHGEKRYSVTNPVMSHHRLIPGFIKELGKKNEEVRYLFHYNHGGKRKVDYDIFRYRNLTVEKLKAELECQT